MVPIPVASRQPSQVAFGSVSPADTHLRRLGSGWAAASGVRARYMVGAVNRMVTRCSRIAASMLSGV